LIGIRLLLHRQFELPILRKELAGSRQYLTENPAFSIFGFGLNMTFRSRTI